jgi:nucleoid DNA-binding protein
MAKAAAKKAAKAASKTEILTDIANAVDLPKKKVAEVFDALTEVIKKNLGNRGPGVFALPGLVKIEKKKMPARPAQKNWLNPFTKQLEDRAAKPAYVKIKVRALSGLKGMVK